MLIPLHSLQVEQKPEWLNFLANCKFPVNPGSFQSLVGASRKINFQTEPLYWPLTYLCPEIRDDKNGRFAERAPLLTILAKLANLAIFRQFCHSTSSFAIYDTRMLKIWRFWRN